MMSFPVVLINTLSILMIVGILLIAWSKRRDSHILQVIIVSSFMLIWAVGSFFEMAAPSFESKLLWRNITQVGVFYVPPATLLLSIHYTGFLYRRRKLLASVIYAVQTLSILFILTDRWHHLARVSVSVAESGALAVQTTSLSKILISLNFVYMCLALITLLLFFLRATRSMRKQVSCIILGLGISLAYSLIKVSSNEMFGVVVPISGAFALTDLFLLLAMVRYDLLMIAPIARNEVFRIVDDGIIITAGGGKIVDANPAALRIFRAVCAEKTDEAVFDRLTEHIGRSFPQWRDALAKQEASKLGFFVESDGRQIHYYTCETYALTNRQGSRAIGSISMIKDVTEQKRQQELLTLQAQRDGLTGIYNRNTFIRQVEAALNGGDKAVSLLFCDLDYFKAVNDRHGHICGDYVLKEMCAFLQTKLRGGELFGRIGGEEFAIFFTGRDAAQTLRFAEDLRNGLQEHTFIYQNEPIRISISIGIASGQARTFDELYRVADLNLLKAKEIRNCVCYTHADAGGQAVARNK